MTTSTTLILGMATLALTGLGSRVASAEGALHVDISGDCVLLDGNGDFVTTKSGDVVATFSKNGNQVVRCDVAEITPSPDGRAVRWNFENTGLACSNFDVNGFQETTRWHVVVAPSGRSRLVCHFPDVPSRP
jgi:hypothetical protein